MGGNFPGGGGHFFWGGQFSRDQFSGEHFSGGYFS